MASLGEQELTRLDVPFTRHEYDYRAKGAAAAAEALGISVEDTVKTLVVRLSGGRLVLLLAPGGAEVSLRRFARALGVRSADLAPPAEAERATGYQPGGISPFGTRRRLPVYAERAVLGRKRVFVNGGRRGLLLELAPADLLSAARAQPVDAVRSRP